MFINSLLFIKFYNLKLKFIFFILEELFIIIIKNIIEIKSTLNIFTFLFFFIYFFNVFLKKNFYKFYKILKIYRHFFFNFLFFTLIFYKLELNENLFYFLRNIYFLIGTKKLNLVSFFLSLTWLFLTLFINIYNNAFFNLVFKKMKYLDLSYKVFFLKIFNLIFFFIILIWGFNYMHLNNIILSIFGAYLGISLSTNVQKILNNYISSLIILFDKNLRIGDAVSINGYQGVITQINNRYTILRNLDCSEILVPNEKLLNEITQNQSLYFSKGNIRINIQVSYNNNLELVLKILINSLYNVERVVDNPPPLSYITNFTIFGVDAELSFWIIDAVRGVALVKSEVYLNIIRNIKENNIELSYYKRVLKIMD